MAKKPCGFDHVECKFKDTCKDKNACRFYHIAKPVYDKPKSQTQCKFGSRCNKPGCPFKHDVVEDNNQRQIRNINPINPENKPVIKSEKPCQFGKDCRRQDCFFKHP